MGEMNNGLYLLQHSPSATTRLPFSLPDFVTQFRKSNVLSAKASTLDMSNIWHFILGHPSLNKMLPLKSVLPSFSGECIETYTICPLAK